MTNIKRPINVHDAYHAHVYFDRGTLELATSLCTEAGERFNLPIGRVHQRNVGPHPKWSCQIAFDSKAFEQLVPWFEQNRQGLTILIHGVTSDEFKDHTEHIYWLGHSAELDLSLFSG